MWAHVQLRITIFLSLGVPVSCNMEAPVDVAHLSDRVKVAFDPSVDRPPTKYLYCRLYSSAGSAVANDRWHRLVVAIFGGHRCGLPIP